MPKLASISPMTSGLGADGRIRERLFRVCATGEKAKAEQLTAKPSTKELTHRIGGIGAA
jgi:hypothetical protein